MSSLEGKLINNTYKDLLQISNNNVGIDGTIRYIEDGEGTTSVLGLNTSSVTVSGNILPETNMTRDIGSVANHWNKIYTHDLWVHGNIGIGTESPAYTLDIVGDINLTGSLKVNGADAVFSNWTVNGSNIYRDTGNVGIGTTNPDTKLHIEDTNANIPGIKISASDQGYEHEVRAQGDGLFISADSTNYGGAGPDIRFNVSGSEHMRIRKTGRVGIGTTDPHTKLQVAYSEGDVTDVPLFQETVRIRGDWTSAGSGPAMTFTNFHTGANDVGPSLDEYNLAAIQASDLDGKWSGGLKFFITPNSDNGGDVGGTSLVEAMRIDSEGTITWGTPSVVGSSFWGVGKISYTKSWDPNSIAYPTIGSGGEGSLIMLDNPHVNYRFDNALSTPSRPFGDTDNASVYGGRAGIRCQIAAKTGSYWDVGLAHVDGDSTADGNEFFVIHKHGSVKPGLVITSGGDTVVGRDIKTCYWNTDGNVRSLVTHADTYVNAYKWAVVGGLARSQGGALGIWDIRTPGPHDFAKGTIGAIFTSWNMNNTSPYADGLGFCTYTDSTGGGDNLLLISKSSNAIKLSRLGYHDNATQSLSDFNNGSIYTVNVTSASDSRVKEDVQPITDALDKIMQLEPVTYKWTDQYIESGASKNAGENIFDDDGNRIMPQNKTTNVGLIAQQVEQVLPTVVHQDRMSLQDETEYLKNIDYEKLVPHLIRAIQEQQARIVALESKLT
jgi:hypothetical protein